MPVRAPTHPVGIGDRQPPPRSNAGHVSEVHAGIPCHREPPAEQIDRDEPRLENTPVRQGEDPMAPIALDRGDAQARALAEVERSAVRTEASEPAPEIREELAALGVQEPAVVTPARRGQ